MSTESQDADDHLLDAAYRSLKRWPKAADAPTEVKTHEKEFTQAQEDILQVISPRECTAPRGTDKAETKDALFLYAVEKSLAYLPGYASLNYPHMRTLVDLQDAVKEYERITRGKRADDIKPLNWLITSDPGQGKSHLVNCITKALKQEQRDVSLVSFNMATMRSADDLVQALDEVRNESVTGLLPILFLDEVDNDKKNFGLLLPLLWDGQIQLGVKRIRIGRAVIVAAGSSKYLVEHRDDKQHADEPPKFRDFLSRIKFRTPIEGLKPKKQGGIDQVCVAIATLRHIYTRVAKEGSEVLGVPVSLLHFIYSIEFRFGVRSLQHLIEFLMHSDKSEDFGSDRVLNIDRLEKALANLDEAGKSGLEAHIHDTHRTSDRQSQLEGLMYAWSMSEKLVGNAPIWCKTFRNLGAPSTWPEDRDLVKFNNALLLRDQSGKRLHRIVGAGIDGVAVLYFNQDLGKWEHGKGKLRHVFFNLNTIATIFHRLEDLGDDLDLVGHEMGKAFGSDFFVNSLKFETNVDMALAIEKWCQFDISGGWGLWKAVKAERADGIITIEDSFLVEETVKRLTPDQITVGERAPHCAIVRGYIRGVLEIFSEKLGGNAKFKVEETRCGIQDFRDGHDTTTCTFEYCEDCEAEPASQRGRSRGRLTQGNRPVT